MELRPYQAAYALSDWAFASSLYLAYPPRYGKTLAEVTALKRRIERGSYKHVIVGPQKPLQMTWIDHLNAADIPSVDLTWGPVVRRASNIGLECVHLVNFDVLEHFVEPIEVVESGKCYRFRKAEYRDDPHEGKALERARMARRRSNCKTIADLLCDWRPDSLIIDEAHLIASPSADRSRALRRIARECKYVRLLSGTPDPRKAPSFYPQYVILDPEVFGTSKARFNEKYFYMSPVIRGKVEGLKPDKADEFWAKVHSRMQVIQAEKYEPLPPIMRTLAWPKPAEELYRAFVRDSVLMDDLLLDGTHKLTKELRCAQMCAGFINDERSGDERIIHTEKEDAIVSDLSEILASGMRCVVSYLFTSGGERVAEALAKAYGQDVVALVNGSTRNATEILRLFDVNCTTETPLRVIVVQEQVGNVGISLARAQHLLFHSWSMDAAAHDQMTKRIWTFDNTPVYTYYQMQKSVDQSRRKVVQSKLDASIMHGNFANFLEGNV